MHRETAIEVLRRHEPELRTLGVVSVSLFGSTARGEAGPVSDVDLAVKLADGPERGLAYIGRLEILKERLASLLGVPVDLIAEPTSRHQLQERIDRDRCLAF